MFYNHMWLVWFLVFFTACSKKTFGDVAQVFDALPVTQLAMLKQCRKLTQTKENFSVTSSCLHMLSDC